MKTLRLMLPIMLILFVIGGAPSAVADTAATAAPDSCIDFPGLMGDLNRDCHYTLVDVVLIVRAIFLYPDDPYPAVADVTCDHYVDIFDVIQLSEYVFSNGPAPQPCQGR